MASGTMSAPSHAPPSEEPAVGSISLPGLLASFLKIGALGFGGGMAVIALMERELIRRRRLLPADQFLHGVGLGQILGSFAVNASFFVGYRLYGLAGALLSVTAFLLPSLTLVIALSDLYFQYHRIPALQGAVAGLGPVVIALILNASWSLGRRAVRTPLAAVIAAAALAAGVLRVNTVWVLLCAGAAGFLLPGISPHPAPPAGGPRRTLSLAVWPLAGTPAMLGPIAATFFKIGLVFFGGGFVLLPVLNERLVHGLHWLTAREFLDGVAISNLTPGPIAVLATFAGFRMAGIAGALAATAALFAPGMALMAFLSREYEKYHHDRRAQRLLAGVNPAVAGMVAAAAVLLCAGAMVSWRGWLAGAVALALLGRFRWHPAFVLAAGAALGYAGFLP
jgi:chromate transporter